MQAKTAPEDGSRPSPPGWVVLALINFASFGVVATLALLSLAFDTFVFDLR